MSGGAYDLLVKNGRIIDSSGRPALHGDVAVAKGKIVELGRLGGPARQVIEADGRAVAPGFVDNHCPYDRGQLQPGMAADLVIFDPGTVQRGKEDVVHDSPTTGGASVSSPRAFTTRWSTARC